MSLIVDNTTIATDREGYLKQLSDWSEDVAKAIAQQQNIVLTESHWEMITLIREFYTVFEISPAMRPLVKFTAIKLGPEKGKSIYLMKLFPGSPTKLLSKIAGLPRPKNCL
jgi:tRNA 2-thiouridine synthesizing protein E